MDVLGIGPVEALFIVVIALIVLGPARMVEVVRNLGRLTQEIRRTTSELPSLLALDEEPPQPAPEDRRKGRPGTQDDTHEERPREG